MITALTIKHEQPNSLKERFRALFSPYEINVKRINDDYLGLEMIHITYVQKSGRIRFGKIKRSVNADFHETVCSSGLSLPRKLGFKRFDNPMYIRRLCINAAESYIKSLNCDPNELRISLFDPSGRFSFAAERFIKYTNSLQVATSAVRFYEAENERFMREYGATIFVHSNFYDIIPCDILVAPQTITMPISCGSTMTIFTGNRTKVPVCGIVHDNFSVRLPVCLEDIKPKELSDTYFLSALYTLEKMKWLERIPTNGGRTILPKNNKNTTKESCDSIDIL